MKRLLTALICTAAILFGTSAMANTKVKASGKNTVEVRDVGSFSGISVSAGIDVYLTQGNSYEVKVKTDANLIDRVETKVKGGVLHITYSKNTNTNRASTAVYVTTPEIKSLSTSSGSDIKTKGIIKGDHLTISASSAGDIKAIVEYNSIKISCSSGSDVELKGNADKCVASASSGADIELDELVCREASLSASSGADISIYVTESLTASASSGADITFYGNPTNRQFNKSSGGDIKGK